ncbi:MULTISPECIES: sensor histidine kinase [Cyanophyceae]|uniref:sensor histidine kinase n=1 Tax=Cyanophyceae TaxID=3028117 RepID=UPI0018F03BCE|nr:PAS domain S-box protein [Trichocoleus sp. FACHB-69]
MFKKKVVTNETAPLAAHLSLIKCYRENMISNLEYLQALRNCCRNEAAFEELKHLLTLAGQSIEEIAIPNQLHEPSANNLTPPPAPLSACLEGLGARCFNDGLTGLDISVPSTQINTDFQSQNVAHSWDFLPTEASISQSVPELNKIAANKLGIIFKLIERNDNSRWLLFAHASCEELLELTSHSARSNLILFRNLVHPEDRESYEQSLIDSADNLQPWIWEGRVITKSGKLKWLQGATRPIVQANGDIFWNGLLIDITERKASEEALLLSEEKFSIAFRHSPDCISITTFKEGRYLEVNDNFLELSGYLREEVIGHTVAEINAWVNPEERIKMQQMLLEQGAVHNLECQFRKKCGEVVAALLSAELVNINGESSVLAVVTDITERKAAEALVRVAAERDRLLYEIALKIRRSLDLNEILNTTVAEVRQFLQADRVFISYFDEDGHARAVAESVDPNFNSILGWVTDDMAFKEVKEIFGGNSIRVINDTTPINKSPFLAEYYHRCQVKAGIGVPIMLGEKLFGLLIANQCSAPREWQQFEIDLIDQLGIQVAIAIQQSSLFQQVQTLNTNLERQVEERTNQLQQKMQELQELNRIKDVVLHTISHDLRTSVQGTVMVFKNLLCSPEEKLTISRSIVERMIQGNERQLCMINSLLESNSTEVQGVVIQRNFVQLNTILPAILIDLEPLLAQNQATLTNLVNWDLPLVMADPTQLQRVLETLFTTTLKHNPPGLNLTLKATVEHQTIRCTLEDDGVGMSQLECDRLFDLYVRDPQSRCSTGTGLKLHLCRQIITAHGGQIGVTSRPNRGTTFWFTLPLATLERQGI